MIPSNHLILCHPFLLPPSIFPSIRVFSDESSRGAVCTGRLGGSHLSWCSLHWASRGLSPLVVQSALGVSGALTSRGAVCTGHLVGSHLSWCCLHWASRGLSALVVSLHWVRRRLLSMYRLPYSPVTEVPSAPIWPPRDQSSEPAKSLEGRTEPGSCPVQSPRCWRPVSFLSHVEPSKRVAVT